MPLRPFNSILPQYRESQNLSMVEQRHRHELAQPHQRTSSKPQTSQKRPSTDPIVSSPLRASFTSQDADGTLNHLVSPLTNGLGPPLIPVCPSSPISFAVSRRGVRLSGDQTEQHLPLNATVQDPMDNMLPHPKSSARHFVGAGMMVDEAGEFSGGIFTVSHRDANTILTIQLKSASRINARPGEPSSPTAVTCAVFLGACHDTRSAQGINCFILCTWILDIKCF